MFKNLQLDASDRSPSAISTCSAIGSLLQFQRKYLRSAPCSISGKKQSPRVLEMPNAVWTAPSRRSVHIAPRNVRPVLFLLTRNSSFTLVYLDPVSHGNAGWPVETIVDGLPDIENVTDALKNGPYGLCVYESANDVCDNQVVNIEFSNGSTASFTMVAFTSAICERQTRLHFSHGEIIGDMSKFTVTDFRKRSTKTHRPVNEGGGHGGGDTGLIRSFVEAVRSKQQDILGTNIDEVLKSHLTVFAAEQSRREGRVVDCIAFEKEAREEKTAEGI